MPARRSAAPDAHLVLDTGDLEAVPRDLDHERAQALVARRVRVGHGEDDDEIGDGTLTDEPLGSVDDVVIAVPHRGRACGGRVGPGLWLGKGEGDQLLTARELREPAGLLLIAPGERDREATELLHGEDEPCRGACPAQLLDGETHGEQLPAEPAVLGRERQRQDVVVGEQPAHVLGELRRPIDLGGARRDAVVSEDADRVSQHLLLVGQTERPLGTARAGHLRHRIAGSGVAGRRTIGSVGSLRSVLGLARGRAVPPRGCGSVVPGGCPWIRRRNSSS